MVAKDGSERASKSIGELLSALLGEAEHSCLRYAAYMHMSMRGERRKEGHSHSTADAIDGTVIVEDVRRRHTAAGFDVYDSETCHQSKQSEERRDRRRKQGEGRSTARPPLTLMLSTERRLSSRGRQAPAHGAQQCSPRQRHLLTTKVSRPRREDGRQRHSA